MITFIELGRLGRLGNQLFQYAALRGLGLSRDYVTKIPDPSDRMWHGQGCLLNNFNIECEFMEEAEVKQLEGRYYEPDYMTFDEKFYVLPDNIDLHGFFQSTLYFKNHEEQIKKELTPKKEIMAAAKKQLNSIRVQHSDYEIVSLHLRRGDNTDGSNPSTELNQMYGKSGDLEEDSFYGVYLTAAKECFSDKKVKYLIFSGGSRQVGNSNESDIEWCKRNFIGDEFIFADENEALMDFAMIMQCDHNIISHISSFGWWAAYLNVNKEALVVAPKHYHPDRPDFEHRVGFYPADWRLI